MFRKILFLSVVCLFMAGCTKESVILVPDNESPFYDEIPTIQVENYVNRIYIDLLGREPLDTEMADDVSLLRSDDLGEASRTALIEKLQTDTLYREGDSTYRRAYYHWQYELLKAHTVEGASPMEIGELRSNSVNALNALIINGDTSSDDYFRLVFEVQKYDDLISAEWEYHNDSIQIDEVMRRMIFNGVYDEINMNSFNFVNATFDNLLYRDPSVEEFTIGYDMVESEVPGVLFGFSGNNKFDYAALFVKSEEFYEGVVKWAFRTLLQRDPTTEETYDALVDFYNTKDLQKVQLDIMLTDEYANF